MMNLWEDSASQRIELNTNESGQHSVCTEVYDTYEYTVSVVQLQRGQFS